MQITDIHAHIFPDAIARRASDSIAEFYHMPVGYDGTVGRLKELHREAGIGRACVHSVAITPHTIDSINRFIAGTVSQDPKMLVGYGSIHPDAEDLPGLVDEARKMGLKGLKIHPDMQRFALDSSKAMEMFAAVEGKLPIIIHTGDYRFEYSHPLQMKKVLDAFPKLVCVCAHLGGWSEWPDAVKYLASYENVFVDTSSSLYALTPAEGRKIIRSYSRDRVLFGTDYPMWTPKEELERFHRLKLTEDEEERILCLNVRQLPGFD